MNINGKFPSENAKKAAEQDEAVNEAAIVAPFSDEDEAEDEFFDAEEEVEVTAIQSATNEDQAEVAPQNDDHSVLTDMKSDDATEEGVEATAYLPESNEDPAEIAPQNDDHSILTDMKSNDAIEEGVEATTIQSASNEDPAEVAPQNDDHSILTDMKSNDATEEGVEATTIQSASNEYNVLLLGETGSGKSTTINAIANYLKYASFDEAKESDQFEELISSKFSLPDPNTGKPMVIQSGVADGNEQHSDGSSSTQEPKSYLFNFQDRRLRIIDTPGIGDTQGVEKDKENFDKILFHLHDYEQLHGICLLVKSNETRKTAYFRYCITELLTHLHKSACNNIVICFTFSRNSFYGPGEGYTTLTHFLDNDLNGVQLKLEPKVNCFFIDNEAYRFLVAKKKGYPFSDHQENSFRDSWEHSVEQSIRMWQHIFQLVPHNLQNTISLNNARKLILELAEPMVRLQNNISVNIANMENEEKRLCSSNTAKEELAKDLFIEVDDLEAKVLDQPRTVCTVSKCTEVVQYQGVRKVNYKTICHRNCQLKGVQLNIADNAILKYCTAMQPSKTTCNSCHCPYQTHMHIKVEYLKVKRTIIDKNTEKEIKSAEDAVEKIKEHLRQMRHLVEEYESEFNVINDITSKFAVLLTANSNTPFNKFIEPYLNLLINEEMKKQSADPDHPLGVYLSLVKMKEAHQENVRILTDAIHRKSEALVRLEDIYKYRQELLNLKHSGPQLQQMLGMTASVKTKELQCQRQNEKRVDMTENSWRMRITGLFTGFTGLFSSSSGKVKGSQQQQQTSHRTPKCLICNQPHQTFSCQDFTPNIRRQIAESKKLCPVCLIPEHQLIDCPSDYKCTKCYGKHSASLCTKGDVRGQQPARGQHLRPANRSPNQHGTYRRPLWK